MVAKDPKIHWEASWQAGQGMLPEGLVPSPWVSRSWAWMLPAAEHPSVPCKDPAEMQSPLHFSSLSMIHQSLGVYTHK